MEFFFPPKGKTCRPSGDFLPSQNEGGRHGWATRSLSWQTLAREGKRAPSGEVGATARHTGDRAHWMGDTNPSPVGRLLTTRPPSDHPNEAPFGWPLFRPGRRKRG